MTTPIVPPSSRPHRKPLSKRWWFWPTAVVLAPISLLFNTVVPAALIAGLIGPHPAPAPTTTTPAVVETTVPQAPTTTVHLSKPSAPAPPTTPAVVDSPKIPVPVTTSAAPAPLNPSPDSATSCSEGSYRNTDGNCIPEPASAPAAPQGATARCVDGTFSYSQHRQGTCSHHGGVAEWL